MPKLAAQLVLARHGLARQELQYLSLPKSLLYAHDFQRCLNMQRTA
jgi:hypothetical protein